MEVKKSPKANLENKKLLFTEIGLVVALALVLAAFEYRTYDKKETMLLEDTTVAVEEEIVPITLDTPPPPPEAPKVPTLSESIEIVDDDINIEDEIDFSTEDQGVNIDIMDYVESGSGEEAIEDEAIPFAVVEEKPTFMGGDENKFSEWCNGKIKYPTIAMENGVQGKVTLIFDVTEEGKVENIKVVRSCDPALDKEAVRVVQSSPKWKPGRQRDKAVRVRFTFPIVFQLN